MRIGETIRGLGLAGFGMAGTAAALLCIALAPRAALTGWLAAAVALQAVPLGALALLALMRLTGGRWQDELRCECEAAAGLWAVILPALVPALGAAWAIYHWPGVSFDTPIQKIWFSGVPVVLRALCWFAALAVIARSQVGGHASPAASILALAVMALGASVLAFDWLMSTDTGLRSFLFGLAVLAVEICIGCLVVVLLRLVHPPALERPRRLAWLLLLLLLLWLAFQCLPFFMGWSSNSGVNGAPYWVLSAVGALGIVPLLCLLLPQVRRSPRAIAFAAMAALAGNVLELGWLAIPGWGTIAALTYLFALCGLGCLAGAYLMPGWTWWPPRRRVADVGPGASPE